jgi:benzodiazapine receptor
MKRIVIAVLATVAVGFLSGLATAASIDNWYATINRPWFAPPNWVFGPVWTMLYILMGIAAGKVWNKGADRADVRRALGFYGAQLLLNAAWSIIFFGLHAMGWALAEMAVLWMLIIATMFAFNRVERVSAWLLLPYIIWVSFALILNAAYVQLN